MGTRWSNIEVGSVKGRLRYYLGEKGEVKGGLASGDSGVSILSVYEGCLQRGISCEGSCGEDRSGSGDSGCGQGVEGGRRDQEEHTSVCSVEEV